MNNNSGGLEPMAELLDRSFGSGPGLLPTPIERLAHGRRVLRRRRRLGVAATSAAVLATASLGVALSGQGGERRAEEPAGPVGTSGIAPTGSSSDPSAEQHRALDRLSREARQQAHRVQQELVSNQFPASLEASGSVVVKDGWRVTQQVDEPIGLQPPEASLGVVVTDGDHTPWMLLTLERGEDENGNPIDELGASASADDPGKGYAHFEDWLASMVAINGGPAAAPLITVDDTDAVNPGPGAEVVALRSMPVVSGYTSQGDRMAEVRRDGRVWFVVLRGHGADAEAIPVDADVLSEPTFVAFLDHVRNQVRSGEGLR